MVRLSSGIRFTSSAVLGFLLALLGAGCTPSVPKPTHFSKKNAASERQAKGDYDNPNETSDADPQADDADSNPGKPVVVKQPGTGGEGPSVPSNPGGTTPPGGTPPGADPTTTVASQIELANTKFAGQETKLEALVKFAGTTSARLKLTSSNGLAAITVPSLIPDTASTLVVELYEGAKLRFVARRANTKFEKGKAGRLNFADCSVAKVPWDGESNQATCGWVIQPLK